MALIRLSEGFIIVIDYYLDDFVTKGILVRILQTEGLASESKMSF